MCFFGLEFKERFVENWNWEKWPINRMAALANAKLRSSDPKMPSSVSDQFICDIGNLAYFRHFGRSFQQCAAASRWRLRIQRSISARQRANRRCERSVSSAILRNAGAVLGGLRLGFGVFLARIVALDKIRRNGGGGRQSLVETTCDADERSEFGPVSPLY